MMGRELMAALAHVIVKNGGLDMEVRVDGNLTIARVTRQSSTAPTWPDFINIELGDMDD